MPQAKKAANSKTSPPPKRGKGKNVPKPPKPAKSVVKRITEDILAAAPPHPANPAIRKTATPEKPKTVIQRTAEGKFPPGVSGNPSGRPKNTPITDAFRMLMETVVPGDKKKRTYGQLIALAAVHGAMKGDIDALKEIANRVEGRTRQAMEITGADGAPIEFADMTAKDFTEAQLAAIVARGK